MPAEYHCNQFGGLAMIVEEYVEKPKKKPFVKKNTFYATIGKVLPTCI